MSGSGNPFSFLLEEVHISLDAVKSFEEGVRKALTGAGIKKGSHVVAAFSGGPDSTALSIVLSRLAREFGYTLELAYVDHGLRPEPELAKERRRVEKLAETLGIPLRLSTLPRESVPALARKAKCGTEAAARLLRYEALASLMDSGRENYLALGHTLSDQAETMAMRFFSGSGVSGLRGIPTGGKRCVRPGDGETAGSFIVTRPLMEFEKSRILAYLRAMGAAWSVDSSNSDPRYVRNRVRAELLPLVGGIFPGYMKSLRTLRGKLLRIEDFLDRSAQRIFKEQGKAAMKAEAEIFYGAHPALRQHALEKAVAKIGPGGRIPYGFIEKCVEAGGSLQGLEKSPILGCGFGLRAGNGCVLLEKRLAHTRKKGYFFPVHGAGRHGPFDSLEFELFDSADPQAGPAYGSFGLPAIMRSAEDLDRLDIDGGEKLLSDLLREWGVPPAERNLIPVLEDQAGIACVLGKAFGYKNRFAERGFRVRPGEGRYLGLKVTGKGGANGR